MRAPDYISEDGSVRLYRGDCLEIMPGLPPVASCVTDPPYGLKFMGKHWDKGVPSVEFWQALNLLPGGALLAFGGCRTYHRMVCAIEDAGFQICNQLAWMFGSGFPKSKDISKGIDAAAGAAGGYGAYKSKDHAVKRKPGNQRMHEGYQRPWRDNPAIEDRNAREYIPATEAAKQWDGWFGGLQNLKPAVEPICYAQAPIAQTYAANALAHGVAGLWINGGRVDSLVLDSERRTCPAGQSRNPTSWDIPGQVAKYNGQRHNPQGRWPANVLLDDVAAAMLDAQSGELTSGANPTRRGSDKFRAAYGAFEGQRNCVAHRGVDTGGASRFFKQFGWGPDDAPEIDRFCYCAKASRKERNAGLDGMPEIERKRTQSGGDDTRGRPTPINRNTHATVKPIALMRYLCRITKTPNGGTIIDPFMGSGTTGIAAVKEGRPFIGIETDPESFEIAVRRIKHAIAERDAELPLEFAENGG